MLILLQNIQADPQPVSQASKSFFEVLIDGGWTMIPIGALFIITIFITIERWLTIRKADADSEELMKQVRKYILAGNLEGAKGLCQSQNNLFARMILKGLNRLGSASLKDIEGAIENVGNLEVYRLERRLSLLATSAGAAPMLGFFGTVLGLINVFNTVVATGGNANAVNLAGGIGVAMITTAAGLVVGITAYLAYNTLSALINKLVFKLELTSSDFIDLLQEPAA